MFSSLKIEIKVNGLEKSFLETVEKLQLSERAMFLLQSSKPKVKGFDQKFIMKVVEGQRKITKQVKWFYLIK